MDAPFHRGEKEAQARAGVREMAEQLGRGMVKDFMTDQHRDFFRQLPLLFVGSVDEGRRPWASVLVGEPGFAHSPTPRRLVVQAAPLPHDPLRKNLEQGAPLGILGLEFATRRRNRLNGSVWKSEPGRFEVRVGQSFGNCPQYIQTRTFRGRRDLDSELVRGVSLNSEVRALVQRSDTFFIASSFDDQGVDMSHRGGKPGFVKVESETELVFPDFSGNNLFNTIGNLTANPRAGLLFIDYQKGDLLYITASSEIVWEGPEVESFEGARRLVKLQVLEWRLVRNSFPLLWELDEYSPSLRVTGQWDTPLWQEYTISRVVSESLSVKSLYLKPAHGEVPDFQAGQHLPIRVPLGEGKSLIRTYSLSQAPGSSELRITVKKEDGGRGSAALHELGAGDRVQARQPAGGFVLDSDSTRPVALLSAGVGVTPLLSMWHSLARRQPDREVWFVHGARSGPEHTLREEVETLAGGPRQVHFRYSRPAAEDRPHSVGRLDVELLQSLFPVEDYDFYLCGPGPFLESLLGGLQELGVPDDRIHFESFGPPLASSKSAQPSSVEFRGSGKSALWTGGTLLELAEANGLRPAFSCRAGACGACAASLLSGNIEYVRKPGFPVAEGEVLLCSAIPASSRLAVEL